MSFAVTPALARVVRAIALLPLIALISCSKEGAVENLRFIGTPPDTAYIGVEYYYEVGIDGGNGIPTVSLSNAPDWLSVEYVDNTARKGVVLRGVPGITGGGKGVGDKTIQQGVNVSINSFDGDLSASMSFPLVVKENILTVVESSAQEGVLNEVPADDDGKPLSDCIVGQTNNGQPLAANETEAYVPITLDQPSERKLTVSFTTEFTGNTADPSVTPTSAIEDNDSDKTGDDYLRFAGNLTFPPKTTLCFIKVIIYDDEIAEDTENFRLKLTGVVDGFGSLDASGGAKDSNLVKIEDNEPIVSFSASRAVVTEGNSISVNAVLDRPPVVPVQAEFEVFIDPNSRAATTAESDDYEIDPVTLTVDFAPNEVSKEITIVAKDNADDSDDRATLFDEKVVLKWKRTATTRESTSTFTAFINEWKTAGIADLSSLDSVQIAGVATDSNSSVYVGYTGIDKTTGKYVGKVDIWNRFGEQLPDSVDFAFATPGFDHKLGGIYLSEFNVSNPSGVSDNVKELLLVGGTEGNTVSTSAGGLDVMLEKWRKVNNGPKFDELAWAKQIGSSFDDMAHAVAVDPSRNIYIAGETEGNINDQINEGQKDAFLLKYDPNGSLTFVRSYGSSGNDVFLDLLVDNNGQNIVSGFTDGAFEDDQIGGKDVLLGAYNREGGVRRLNQYGSVLDEEGSSLASLGNAIVQGGYTRGSIEGEPSLGGEDAFVTYNGTASFVDDTVQFGSPGNDRVNDIATDGNLIFATGYASGPINSSTSYSGGRDAFLSGFSVVDEENAKKITTVWHREVGTAADEEGSGVVITPSHKIMWLVKRTEPGGDTFLEIYPYTEDGESLIP